MDGIWGPSYGQIHMQNQAWIPPLFRSNFHFLCLLGSMDLQRLTSHPVHLVDPDGNLNPTALVPFCSVSDDYSAMGVKIDQIGVPVCNSFRPKIIKDQMCYTVDPNKYKDKIDLNDVLSLSLFINYNEDMEITLEMFADNIANNNVIIIETIGKHLFVMIKSFLLSNQCFY